MLLARGQGDAGLDVGHAGLRRLRAGDGATGDADLVDGDPGGDLPGVIEVVGEARLGGGVGHRDGVGLVEGGATVDLLGALGDLGEGLVDTGVRDDGVDDLDPHGSLRGVGHGEGDTAGVAVGRGHGGGGELPLLVARVGDHLEGGRVLPADASAGGGSGLLESPGVTSILGDGAGGAHALGGQVRDVALGIHRDLAGGGTLAVGTRGAGVAQGVGAGRGGVGGALNALDRADGGLLGLLVHDAGDVLALPQHELVVRADGHVTAVVVGADPGAVLRVALGAVARGQAVGAAGGVDLADGGRAAGTGDGLLPEEPIGGGLGGQGPLLGPGAAAVDDVDEGDAPTADDVLVVPDALDGALVLVLGELGLIEADRALVKIYRVGLVQAGGSVTAQQRGTTGTHRAGDVAQEPAGRQGVTVLPVDGGLRAGTRLLHRGGVVGGQQGVAGGVDVLSVPGGGQGLGGPPVLRTVAPLLRGVDVVEGGDRQRSANR